MSVLRMSQIAVQAHAESQQPEARRGYPMTGAQAPPAPAAPAPAAQPPAASPGGTVAAAVNAIETYIPTEVVTIYAAVTAAIDSTGSHSRAGQWVAFWLFLVLTPVANWCFYAGMLRGKKEAIPWHPKLWPWFGLITATIAFALWGFTLPGTPFKDFTWYDGSIGAPVLLVGSMVLGFAGSVFGPVTTAQPASG